MNTTPKNEKNCTIREKAKKSRSQKGFIFRFFIIYIIEINFFARIDLWVQMGECMARWFTCGITFIFL
jgi:hypothetical protein